jgi:hypothetical protein
MKRTLGVVSVSIVALVAVACGSPDSDPVAQNGQDLATATAASAAGGLRHAYARPDERACPSPACGGYWLVAPAFHNACHDQASSTYVAGIFAGNQEISPPCSELLTGTLVPDPRDPQFNIFELELTP